MSRRDWANDARRKAAGRSARERADLAAHIAALTTAYSAQQVRKAELRKLAAEAALALVCPCGHTASVWLSRRQVMARRFRCSGCNASYPGARLMPNGVLLP